MLDTCDESSDRITVALGGDSKRMSASRCQAQAICLTLLPQQQRDGEVALSIALIVIASSVSRQSRIHSYASFESRPSPSVVIAVTVPCTPGGKRIVTEKFPEASTVATLP